MTKQIYFEDIVLDSEISPLIKRPSTRQLVMWAGASGDYQEIHYDKDWAQERGLPGPIVHGQLSCSFLGELLTDWMGDGGTFKRLACTYRGMNLPREPVVCKGKISKKYVKDRECYVELELWTESPKGEKTVLAAATVTLPSRG